MRCLLVEDDVMVGGLLHKALTDAAYRVELCSDAFSADLALQTQDFDVAVLDIGLPGVSGLDLLKAIRRRQVDIPVLILSARLAPQDRVLGLDLGADDYLVKPFDLDELLARLRTIVRRKHGRLENTIRSGRLEFDPGRLRVTLDGQDVSLQPKEMRLLAFLLHRQGRPASKTDIEGHIYDDGDDFESNTVEALVYSLRRKLGRDTITTRRGLGYAIAG